MTLEYREISSHGAGIIYIHFLIDVVPAVAVVVT